MKDSCDGAKLSIFQTTKVTGYTVLVTLPTYEPSHLLNPIVEKLLMFSAIEESKITKRGKYKQNYD